MPQKVTIELKWTSVTPLLLVGILINALAESLHRARRAADAAERGEREQAERFRVTLANVGDAVIESPDERRDQEGRAAGLTPDALLPNYSSAAGRANQLRRVCSKRVVSGFTSATCGLRAGSSWDDRAELRRLDQRVQERGHLGPAQSQTRRPDGCGGRTCHGLSSLPRTRSIRTSSGAIVMTSPSGAGSITSTPHSRSAAPEARALG
jgi:hypothetical protein